MADKPKENDKAQGTAPAAQTATTEAAKKRPPRLVDDSISEREPVLVIDVKESTPQAAAKFLAKAMAAIVKSEAEGGYDATSVKGSIKVYSEVED